MNETQDNLNWLAFRYVVNELDATEVTEFELLLLTDQLAREAVAEAVSESTLIRQALASEVVVSAESQRSSWNRKSTRLAFVAIGSCLTLLLAICLARPSFPITGGVAHQTIANDLPDSSAALAYAWAEARVGATEFEPAARDVLVDSLDAVLLASIDADSEQSLVAPSWMLAALAKMDSRIDADIEIQE